MKAFWLACPVFVTVFAVAAAGQQGTRIDDAALTRAGGTDEEWLTYGINQAETRFSPLAEINKNNVGNLQVAWIFQPGESRQGLHSTPLVVDGFMYISTNPSTAMTLPSGCTINGLMSTLMTSCRSSARRPRPTSTLAN